MYIPIIIIIVPVKTFEGNVVRYEGKINFSNVSIARTHTDFYKIWGHLLIAEPAF